MTVYKSALTAIISTLFIASCTTTVHQIQPSVTPQQGKRIFIPQEKVTIQTPVPQKTVPASYIQWISQDNHQQQVAEYEKFLNQNNVGNIVPAFELLRTARDWQKCGSSEYAVPNRELWANQVPTLKVFKYLVATKVLTDFEVTSVYRDLPTNQCAGGANSSRHLYNSAIDFRLGPVIPQPQDYIAIENTKFKLCQFWAQYGQSLNMGIGLYASGQIHVDTQGYRTWGPNLSHSSSMCNF
ncbi:D-Ala-D-Ala carboxypeptidase family metallohydrolase [Acinetobacter sp. HY1485]|uniref:D-Ala-D-Ala carboxypeptidase family metallohydrolase n=1 Tax=Acinetobacter sp. HY1485 TaxID=2970918 RepID=UPI0022B9AAD6|nr:D-Ala-D-Ala carboxypeptidase family metallohydrolase [Acinetobacter sp. HY1485]